jgi:hypothetical protein
VTLSDEELSLYEIAFYLKMPLQRILHEMSYEELLGWHNYFERRPYGWRDDARAAKLLQAQGVKAKPEAIFPSLQTIYNPPISVGAAHGQLDIQNFKRSHLFSKLLSASGGDKLDLNEN